MRLRRNPTGLFLRSFGAASLPLFALLVFSGAAARPVFAGEILSGEMTNAEMNPTGQPVGGGRGYSAGPEPSRAAHCVHSLATLQRALAGSKPGDLVWIQSGSVIDLEDRQIVVPEHVTLAGDRGAGDSPGPLITAGHTALEWRIRLERGARLSGVRLRGPNPRTGDIDTVRPPPSAYAVTSEDGEVDNCEISHFQRGGIAHFRHSSRGHVHHNHLHDIAAYPVLVGNGSGDGHLFEANRIEWAWHAIASNGSRGSGYTARYNVFIRMPRPRLYDEGGADPPNWCLDVHANSGVPTNPPRPATRKLVAHHNTFLADPAVRVGDGSDLIQTINAYPKHDIYVGSAENLTTSVTVHHNRFLMHQTAGSKHPFKPYGQAVRLVGFKGHPAQLPDDPAPAKGAWDVTLSDNIFHGGK